MSENTAKALAYLNAINTINDNDWKETNRACVYIKILDHNYIILKKPYQKKYEELNYEKLKWKSIELYDNGVNLARTLDYRLYDAADSKSWGNVYLLQDMAPGVDLYSFMYNKSDLRQQFANESQNLFDKYVSDFMKIYQNLGDVDSNWENLFYSAGKITFIDLYPGKFREKMVTTPEFIYENFTKRLPYEPDDKNIDTIREKMKQAAKNYLE